MAPIKVTKRRMKTIEKEMKLITSCLRTRMVSGQQGTGEQFLELPRFIATEYGIPQKGQKSNITKYYQSIYSKAFIDKFPPGWLPESVIIEGMFIINAAPIKNQSMFEYVKYLFERFLGWYIHAGVAEIHVFDSPGNFPLHPKKIER